MNAVAQINPMQALLNMQAVNCLKNLSEAPVFFCEESYQSKPVLLDTSKVDVTIFKAILQEAGKPNRNGRIYTKKAIDEALHRTMVVEKLQHKAFYGENGHPIEDTVKRQTYIDQRNISHIVTKYWWEGNLLWGEIETANTSAGRDFQGLIRQGCGVSFSMRGVGGDVKKKDGYEYIDSGLYIMCYDNVTIPSHAPAYIQEIIKEEGGVLNESFTDMPYSSNSKFTVATPSDLDSIAQSLQETSHVDFNSHIMVDNFLRDF